jgi:hypothetical protein
LEELKVIEVDDHVVFELVPQIFDLFPFVGVFLDVLVFLEVELELVHFLSELGDGSLQLLHALQGLGVNLLGCDLVVYYRLTLASLSQLMGCLLNSFNALLSLAFLLI